MVVTGVRKNRATLERLSLALVITLAISYLFYGFFQTGMHRPSLDGMNGWLVDLVTSVYGSDNPYNAFPSSHASITTVCLLALCQWRRIRLPAIVWAFLIVASTVLVKQHYLADALAGIVLGGFSFLIAGWFLSTRTNTIGDC